MKTLVMALVILATIYAPGELTRLIVKYGFTFDTTLELVAIWFMYLVAMGTLIKVLGVLNA